jgi:hypothetical protein
MSVKLQTIAKEALVGSISLPDVLRVIVSLGQFWFEGKKLKVVSNENKGGQQDSDC